MQPPDPALASRVLHMPSQELRPVACLCSYCGYIGLRSAIVAMLAHGLNWQVSKITARTLWVAIVIGCGMMLTIWTAAPTIVSRMGAKADVAACVHSFA